MGKAQSKRSVDITTEQTKKGPEGAAGDEVTGKLEKIEDIDQKQVNGDATPQEKKDAGDKKDAPPDGGETENDKDLTTEKKCNGGEDTTAAAADAGAGDQSNATESSPKEDAAASPKEGEEVTAAADDSVNKKAKKEKVKKKWSFRSISFGKKDKQKPPKTDSTEKADATAAATTNGEATDKPVEGEAAPSEETAAAAANTEGEASAKPVENGVASEKEQQMNGEKTPTTPSAEEKETATTVTEPTTTTASNETPATAKPAVVDEVKTEVAKEQTETKTTAVVAEVEKTINHAETVMTNGTNGTAAEVMKNGDAEHVNESNHTDEQAKVAADDLKTIPDEKPHQNGTNGDAAEHEVMKNDDCITNKTSSLNEVKNLNQFELNECEKNIEIVNNINQNNTNDIKITATDSTTTTSTSKMITDLDESIEQNEKIGIESETSTDVEKSTEQPLAQPQPESQIPVVVVVPAQCTENLENTQETVDPEPIKNQIEVDDMKNSNENLLANQIVTEVTMHSSPVDVENEVETVIDSTCTSASNDEKPAVEQLQTPPPLPNSPPPSQVIAFALETQEDTVIQDKEEEQSTQNVSEEKECQQESSTQDQISSADSEIKSENVENESELEKDSMPIVENGTTHVEEEDHKTSVEVPETMASSAVENGVHESGISKTELEVLKEAVIPSEHCDNQVVEDIKLLSENSINIVVSRSENDDIDENNVVIETLPPPTEVSVDNASIPNDEVVNIIENTENDEKILQETEDDKLSDVTPANNESDAIAPSEQVEEDQKLPSDAPPESPISESEGDENESKIVTNNTTDSGENEASSNEAQGNPSIPDEFSQNDNIVIEPESDIIKSEIIIEEMTASEHSISQVADKQKTFSASNLIPIVDEAVSESEDAKNCQDNVAMAEPKIDIVELETVIETDIVAPSEECSEKIINDEIDLILETVMENVTASEPTADSKASVANNDEEESIAAFMTDEVTQKAIQIIEEKLLQETESHNDEVVRDNDSAASDEKTMQEKNEIRLATENEKDEIVENQMKSLQAENIGIVSQENSDNKDEVENQADQESENKEVNEFQDEVHAAESCLHESEINNENHCSNSNSNGDINIRPLSPSSTNNSSIINLIKTNGDVETAKDIVNAMDLKENAAAADNITTTTTQDVAVCE